MDYSRMLVVLVTVACAVPVGLLLRSAAETKLGSPEPRLFVVDGALGLAAKFVEKGGVGLTLFFGPSLTVLWLLHQMPESTFEKRVWWTVNLAGIGVGKMIRWLRWRRTQDFVWQPQADARQRPFTSNLSPEPLLNTELFASWNPVE